MGPGGMGGGGPGGHGPQPGASRPERTLDDLLPPDPWWHWQERLLQAREGLALTPAQAPVFEAFVHELDELRRLNGQRVMRALRPAPPVVSAVVDVARDLRNEAGDAHDWQQALEDLGQRWQALVAVLQPGQRAQVEAAYQASRRGGAAAPPPRPANAALPAD